MLPGGSVDPGDPQPAEVTLAVAAVAVAVLIGLEQRLLGHPVVPAGVAPEALRHGQRRAPLLAGVDRALHARHDFLAPSSVLTRGVSCLEMSAGRPSRRLRLT